jgi:hypothetical protein
MSDNKVKQTDIQASGDVTGRDKITHQPSYNFGTSQARVSYMAELLERFKEELDSDSQLKDFIKEFDYYNAKIEGDVLGLEQKLRDGNREFLIDFALRAKEKFYKKALKFQFSESAQKINVFLLAKVESNFFNHIAPKIRDGHPVDEVNSLIQELLIKPVLQELDDNLLDFNDTDINGMLYFLTGNCHIKWTA